ncbi:MAG: hypothetical protein II956_03295 [Bacteroidales bacterium]|nr:hypothetical protein [Bacteroidales bacterium]
MGFLKRLFIVEEEGDKKPEQQTSAPVQQQAQQVQPQVQQPYIPQQQTYAQPQGGKADENILKMISDVIEQHNIPGNDYYELNKIIESQEFMNAIPDRRSRIISAFFSLKAQDPKVNKQTILESIDFYKDVVNKEYQNVLTGYNECVEEQVNAPKKEIENLMAQRQELLDKIAALDQTVSSLQQEIMTKTFELSNKKADYDVSFNLVLKNLDNEKIELNNILQ